MPTTTHFMTTMTNHQSGLPTPRLSGSPTGITHPSDARYRVAGGSATFSVNEHHPLLYHLPQVDWGVFGTVTWGNVGRRVDSVRASHNREKDFTGALHQTCAVLKLHARDLGIYRATEFGAGGECHVHFLVAKEGLKHVTPHEFAETFTHLWCEAFQPLDSKFCGVGKAEVEPYDQIYGHRGVSYCLKREWDEKGRERERYDYISPKLFNLLQRGGLLDEKMDFRNN